MKTSSVKSSVKRIGIVVLGGAALIISDVAFSVTYEELLNKKYMYEYGQSWEPARGNDGGTYNDYIADDWQVSASPEIDDGIFNDYSYDKTSDLRFNFAITQIAESGANPYEIGDVFFENENSPIYATSALGMAPIPSSANPYSPYDPNLGQLGDGLLNGQQFNGNKPEYKGYDGIVDPLYFIDKEDLYEVDGELAPGWLSIWQNEDVNEQGYVGGYSNIDASRSDDPVWYDPDDATQSFYNAVHLSDLISVKFTCADEAISDAFGGNCTEGSWTLWLDQALPQVVSTILGENMFDHLAIELGYGSEWVIADWDFLYLIEEYGFAVPDNFFTSSYTFTGTWSTGGKTAASHGGLHARDPGPKANVPAPATLALLGLGLAGIGYSKRRKLTATRSSKP